MNDRARQRVDHEPRRHAGQPFVGFFLPDLVGLGARHAFDVFSRIQAHAFRQFRLLVLVFAQPREDGEHGGHAQQVRVEVDFLERLRARSELAVDSRLFRIGKRIRHLDDDHAIEQRLVFRLLQKLAEFRQVGVRDDGLVEVDQGEARDLDILQEFALDLQDFDHFQQPAAGGVYRARPRPGARVSLVAVFRDLRQVDRTDQVGDVRRGRIMRRIGADADAAGLGDKDPLHRQLHEIAGELAGEAAGAEGAEFAADFDVVSFAKCGPQRMRNEMQRRLVHRTALDTVNGAGLRVAVFFQPAL